MQRVALITGGASGIGASIAETLAAASYIVIVNHRNNDEQAQRFAATHKNLRLSKFDVANFEEVQKALEDLSKEYGFIDTLINNAGITRDGMLHKMDLTQWQEVINTNLSGAFNTCRALIPAMREKGFGRVVNISSINAAKGQFGQTNYCAAKAGLLGFTKALALENAVKGITVNAVAPGYTDTNMVRKVAEPILQSIIDEIPMKRLAAPEEIAHMVKYLCSEEAGFVTGATFHINGGQYME